MPYTDNNNDVLPIHKGRRESTHVLPALPLGGTRRDSAPVLMLGTDRQGRRVSVAGQRERGLSLSQVAEQVNKSMHVIKLLKLSTEKSLPIWRPPVPNTYQMEPPEEGRFRPGMIKRLTEEILDDALKNINGYEKNCSNLSCTISGRVKDAVKMSCPRHKVICHVMMLEDRQQGSRSVTRCLWDTDRDNMAVVSYVKNDLNVTVTVYGIYQE